MLSYSHEVGLGICYERGQGVKQDYKQAIYWYRKAAKQGNEIAKKNLAFIYADGRGIKQPDKQEDAQDNGNSQYNLARNYDYGRGVEKDYKQAAYWYRKAAEQGHIIAQNQLGFMYDYGRGVNQDDEQAAYWRRKAAEHKYF